MASEDDGYILDADANRILIGLTLNETREFERLDNLISNLSSAATDANRSRSERRWLMLYDRHGAAVRVYLSTENAKALNALRTERAPRDAVPHEQPKRVVHTVRIGERRNRSARHH
jgi:hypothetical protein